MIAIQLKVLKNLFNRVSVFNIKSYSILIGARGRVVVKALCYKPEGRGFETR
jgi:hypothetical protein